MYYFLSDFILSFTTLSYLIVFLGMFFEGDIFLFITAFLTHLGLFNPLFVFITVFSGVIIGDILWYYLGISAHKYPFVAKWLSRITSKADDLLHKRTFQTLFISKFAYGFHHILLMRAGFLKLNLKRFVKNDLLASILWIAIIGGLGYGAGASFDLVRRYLKFAEVFLLILIIVFLFAERLVGSRLKKKI